MSVCVATVHAGQTLPQPQFSPGFLNIGLSPSLCQVWASLVAQLVKNLPVMWDMWVRSLGWEDTLEKGKATHSSILVRRIPWTP